MTNKQKQLERLSKLEAEAAELRKLIEQGEEKKSIWNLEIKDKYWLITDEGDVDFDQWESYTADIGRLNIGNIYLTKEEAEKALAKQKALTAIKKYMWSEGMEEVDWSDKDSIKYLINYSHEDKKFETNSWSVRQHSTLPYFTSILDAQKVIDNCKSELETLFLL